MRSGHPRRAMEHYPARMGLRRWWRRHRARQQIVPASQSESRCRRIDLASTDSREDMIKKVQARGLPYADAASIIDMLVEDRTRPWQA